MNSPTNSSWPSWMDDLRDMAKVDPFRSHGSSALRMHDTVNWPTRSWWSRWTMWVEVSSMSPSRCCRAGNSSRIPGQNVDEDCSGVELGMELFWWLWNFWFNFFMCLLCGKFNIFTVSRACLYCYFFLRRECFSLGHRCLLYFIFCWLEKSWLLFISTACAAGTLSPEMSFSRIIKAHFCTSCQTWNPSAKRLRIFSHQFSWSSLKWRD